MESATIELAIDLLDNGEVSPFFHEVAAIGDEIELRGPLGGHFVWSPSDGGPLLLVGGGSGLVPLMSMIRDRHAVEVRRAGTAPAVGAQLGGSPLPRRAHRATSSMDDGFSVVFALTREASDAPMAIIAGGSTGR